MGLKHITYVIQEQISSIYEVTFSKVLHILEVSTVAYKKLGLQCELLK